MSIFNLETLSGGESKVETAPQVTDVTEESQVKEINVVSGKKDQSPGGQEKAIVLDGPLSHIYTEALNQAFSLEGFAANPATFSSNGPVVEPEDLYVYCCDGDNLDSGQLLDFINKMTDATNHGAELLVAVECNKIVPKQIGHIESYCKANNIKVHYSTESLISTIKNKV